METLVIQTHSKAQSKALVALAKAWEMKLAFLDDLEDARLIEMMKDSVSSGLSSELETKDFIESLGK